MSHLKERSQKNCLNCNAQVYGKYCHICGQENIETVETLWHLIKHFFNDVTHFDGKFFGTLKYLVFRPGFLSAEYKMGRRAAYLNPIKMYVFTSAIFFLIFFSVRDVAGTAFSTTYDKKTKAEIAGMDSTAFDSFTKAINYGDPMTRAEFQLYSDSVDSQGGFHFTGTPYVSKAAYDSVVRSGKKKHSWIERQLIYREIEMNEKYNNDRKQIGRAFLSNFTHSFPQILFLSLPLIAMLLKLIYIRRKQYFYVDHAIFSVHFYIFTFIVLMCHLLFTELAEWTHSGLFAYLTGLLYVLLFFYEYKAMRNYYRQSRGKTLLKYFLLNSLFIILLFFLMVVFMIFSFMKI